jgi:hypothetical protein
MIACQLEDEIHAIESRIALDRSSEREIFVELLTRLDSRLYIYLLPVRESAFSKDEKTKQPPLIVKRLNGYDIWIL